MTNTDFKLDSKLSRRGVLAGIAGVAVATAVSPGGVLLPQPLSAAVRDTYPYKTASPNAVDPWNFYYRYCTSYVAHKVNEAGRAFTNQTGGGRFSHAHNWDDNARWS